MVNLVRAIMSTDKSDEKQMKWLKKQLRSNERDINKQRANMAPIHAAVFTDNTEIVKIIVKTKGVNEYWLIIFKLNVIWGCIFQCHSILN